ncbi:MAG: hypothetical protein F4078_00025 [Acidimicrobiia bacterium]|nr:hypothetical protein [Acidimicrobiia bacterium]MYJ12724.1 hypothetical protein [Acidimicrobiia bacterium]
MSNAEIVNVTVEGALTRTDDQGVERPVTEGDFDDCFARIADAVYDDGDISSPVLWGQASTGDLELSFSHEAADDPRSIISRIMADVGVVSVDRTRSAAVAHNVEPTVLRLPAPSPAIRIGALSERVAAAQT